MKEVIELLEKNFKSISIFLYGSRARKDFLKESDFEMGIIFRKKDYVRSGEIRKIVNRKGFNIYPFEYESFIKGMLDTPFQKKIYLRELVLTGKTLSGKKIVENMKAPQINIIDIIQDLRFNLGYALASIISHRNGDKKTASLEFYKSCLFATRDLEMLKLKVFPLTYEEILRNSKKINLGEYKRLIEKAFKVRNGKDKYEEGELFKNISYINNFIEPFLLKSFEENNNEKLIKEVFLLNASKR